MSITVLSPKQRVESTFHSYFRTNFATADEFAGVEFLKGQAQAEKTLPNIIFSCETADEQESPGLGLYRARLSVVLTSSIDEGPAVVPGKHLQRVDSFVNWLGWPDLTDALYSTAYANGLKVFAVIIVGTSNDRDARHVVDMIDVDVHCQPIA